MLFSQFNTEIAVRKVDDLRDFVSPLFAIKKNVHPTTYQQLQSFLILQGLYDVRARHKNI